MIDYSIVSTGSQGNAVVLGGGILIDIGVPFKALRDVYRDLRMVLLSHVHSDHFRRATVRRLAYERPSLRWGCPPWMVVPALECGVDKTNIDVYTLPSGCYDYPGFCTVKIDETVHNVQNCAYHIWRGGESVFFATDTNSLDGIEAKGYSLYLIEANYGEAEIEERIRHKQEAGEFIHEYAARDFHLSRERADAFLAANMGPHSRYAYLHGHRDAETA